MPGYGKSKYVSSWNIYEPESLVDILETVLEDHVKTHEGEREIVLVGHSMGGQLCARLAKRLGPRCVGMVAICPPYNVDKKLQDSQKILGYMPPFIFNIFRAVDRLGGLHSPSVNRMIAENHPPDADEAIRRSQLRTNLQVNTRAWLRTAHAFQAVDAELWKSLTCPVLLIAAANDQVVPVEGVNIIHSWLGSSSEGIEPVTIHDAGHSCLIERPHVICGLISDFISKQVDEKLSPGWQLAYLASMSNKWSLKNEDKWRSVQNISDRIKGTCFRGMKTLRQDDPVHSPSIIESKYPDITDIIDISRESPPYDPTTFNRIAYHKFPTVSKLPPTKEEVAAFISLVDKCLEESSKTHSDSVIAVHCHYGFNRTGFFLCCYMIERNHFTISQALDAFKEARNPGIKHPHFVDELYVRYEL